MNWLGNIWTLTIHCYNDDCCLIIHSDFIWIVANFFNGLSCDLLEINFSLSMNLSKDHTDWVFDSTFTCNFGVWILSKASIKNWVRNVIAKFIRMTAGNIFWGEEKVSRFDFVIHRGKVEVWYFIIILGFYLTC